MPHVEVEATPVAASTLAVAAGLHAFNASHMQRADAVPFNVILRDDDGAVVGGALCEVRWHWLFVDMLWVSDACRGQGAGTALLAAAEAEARRRGCTRAHLDTISFQARPFYEKLGWTLFGTLDDYPPGHTRYYLQKDISHSS
jgi:GNAT superfamily N-acetyltransferase